MGSKYSASIRALMHLQAWKQPRILNKNKLRKIKAQKAFNYFFQKLRPKLIFFRSETWLG